MRKWIIVAVVVVLALGIFIGLQQARPRIHSYLHERAMNILQTHFASDVQFTDFQVTLLPRARVSITGLSLRYKGRTDIPPLIQASEVTVEASLPNLFRTRMEIAKVVLVGLQIHTPPRSAGPTPLIHKTNQDLADKYPVLIRNVQADNAEIVILRAQPGKEPRVFAIQHLSMSDLSFDRPAEFHAILTNPVPRGQIDSVGQFGPWEGEEPSSTPVQAKFTFENADFKTIKGLSGTLSSKGDYGGPLDYLAVHGETDTPDFALNISGHPESLHTDYDAVVDGTNGNVILNSVLAKLRNSSLHVKGEVVDVYPKEKGRTIKLDAVSNDARIEDLLWLAVKSDQPVMTGAATLKTKIEIAEGDEDILQRLSLDGQFGVSSAVFTSNTVQEKVDKLSAKGQGEPKATDLGTAVSELKGNFVVVKGLVTLSKLSFHVAGATVQLNGTYNMPSGEMDFRGHLLLDAKLSQTTTGVKSFFLKAVDPFFKGKHGGSDLPIRITGTKDHPQFGLDLHDPTNKKQ
jgi:uncharacterized protein involved in outer membrane biogenesis